MKFLSNYNQFYKSIFEQEGAEKPAQGEKPPVSGGVPQWFTDAFWTASKAKTKSGGKLVLDAREIPQTWEIVEKLAKLSNQKFGSVNDIQAYLWQKMSDLDCLSKEPGAEPQTLKQQLDEFRKGKGLPESSEEKFVDGRYGAQTNQILWAVICLLEGAELTKQQEEMAKKNALPNIQLVEVDSSKTVGAGEIAKKAEEEGSTGLTPEELKKKAETIINDSLIPDETESKDKFKIGANKMGARIVYKDKGASRLGPDELAILDEFFLTDGFVRTKSVEKGGIIRNKFMKYVWVKKLNPGSSEAKAALDDIRKKKKPEAKPAAPAAQAAPAAAPVASTANKLQKPGEERPGEGGVGVQI